MGKCFGAMGKTGRTVTDTTSQTRPDAWAVDAGRGLFGRGLNFLNQGYQQYQGDRVANMSPYEQRAGGMISRMAGSGNPYQNEQQGMLRGYAGAGPQQFDFNTVVDEKGPLGSIKSYMNPYTQNVLDPALREIQKAGMQQRQGIGSQAQMAGAFGDARHGVVEGQQMTGEMQTNADTTGRAYNQAFESAMGQRQQDLGRNFQTQQSQAAANEQALQRKLTGAGALTDLDRYNTGRQMDLAQKLGQFGQLGRDIKQRGLDTRYQDFQNQRNFTPQMLTLLSGILGAAPKGSTTTGHGVQETFAPNNTGWNMLGALGGTAMNMFTGGMSGGMGGSGGLSSLFSMFGGGQPNYWGGGKGGY
jgi:hypothetical protein